MLDGSLNRLLVGLQDWALAGLLDKLLNGLLDELLEGLLDGMLEGLKSWVAGEKGMLFYGKLDGFVRWLDYWVVLTWFLVCFDMVEYDTNYFSWDSKLLN